MSAETLRTEGQTFDFDPPTENLDPSLKVERINGSKIMERALIYGCIVGATLCSALVGLMNQEYMREVPRTITGNTTPEGWMGVYILMSGAMVGVFVGAVGGIASGAVRINLYHRRALSTG